MSTEDRRISLNSGYTKNGFADKVFHIHLRYVGDNDELYFRDYLKDHPQIAKEYETLKLGLRNNLNTIEMLIQKLKQNSSENGLL